MSQARPTSPAPIDPPIRLTVGPRTAGAAALPAWIALSVFGRPFETLTAEADQQGDRPNGAPAHGPVLQQDGLVVWGPLAVLTHLGERRPAMWPNDRAARAQARSVMAEVASGFAELRAAGALDRGGQPVPDRLAHGLARDVGRFRRLVGGLRGAVATAAGPFLFGRFCLADAMLASLTGDLLRRMVASDAVCRNYVRALDSLPAMRAWLQDAAPAPAVEEAAAVPVEHLVGPEAAEQAERLAEESALVQPEPEPSPPKAVEPEPVEAVAEPPLPPSAPPTRLEDADRPKIAYLDEPKSPSWRALPIVERISGPPPIPPVPSRGGTPAPPAEERPRRAPERDAPPPRDPPPSVGRRQSPTRSTGLAEDDNPFLFRLRRPGTTSLPFTPERKERDRASDPPESSWSGAGRPIGRPRRR